MKKFRFYFLLFLMFIPILVLKSQTYSEKKIFIKYDDWDFKLSYSSQISISSYVTKQKILTNKDFKQNEKSVSILPKYRFELILTSKSTIDTKLVSTWIFNTRVFINDVDINKNRFPNGFTVLIKNKPTLIYWYETDADSINIKITWENCKNF